MSTKNTMTLPTSLGRPEIDRLFAGSHTAHAFADAPVDPVVVQQVYEDLRWAPTSFNAQPLRLTVLTPGATREKVAENMMDSNRAKTLAAPLTVVAAYTPDWHEYMPHLAPQREGFRDDMHEKELMRENVGRLSALLQTGYLLLAFRAHGLEVGPMTGIDAEGIDSVVHTDNSWKTLVVVNIGYAAEDNPDAVDERRGRLAFHDAAQVL